MSSLQYLDIQPFLSRVSNSMAVGELLHPENFDLHDAMMAVEIGDPKMDFGMRHNEVPPLEDFIAKGDAPVVLPEDQLIALMDKLLVNEAAWHQASLLPQTVFTSLYMLDIERIKKENPVLHAYCVAIRAACSAVYNLILDGQVCEDEDVAMHIFGISLDKSGAGPQKEAIKTLLNAEKLLEDQLKNLACSQPPAKEGDSSSSYIKAALHRLRFRRSILELFLAIPAQTPKQLDDIQKLCDAALAQLTIIESSVGLAGSAIAPGFVPEINRRHMGMVPPRPIAQLTVSQAMNHWRELLQGIRDVQQSLPLQGGWPALSGMLCQFAAKGAPAIVRSVMHLTLVYVLRQQQQKMLSSQQLLPIISNNNTSSKSGQGANPNPSQQQQQSDDDVRELPPWCPCQAMMCREFQLDTDIKKLPGDDTALFIEQVAIAVQGICHTLCLNRSRQRRGQKRLLRDWVNMTDHAWNAEASELLQQHFAKAGWKWTPTDAQGNHIFGPFSCWVQREAISSMLMHLMLGFPTDVYAPHEFTAVYFYCDYLLSEAQQVTQDLVRMLPQPKGPLPSRQQKKAGAKGSGKAAAAAAGLTVAQQQMEERNYLMMWGIQLERTMCQATVKLCLGLDRLGQLPPPAAALNTPKERYNQRFHSFEKIFKPDMLHYEQYQMAIGDTAIPTMHYMRRALEAYMAAVADVSALMASPSVRMLREEQIKHFTGIKRIAATNITALHIFMKALEGSHEDDEALKQKAAAFSVKWDFKVGMQHSAAFFYPCLSLKSVRSKS